MLAPLLGAGGAVRERVHIGQIDALRGLAALGVALLAHINILLGSKGAQPFPLPSFLYAISWTFVDLFFVISGYVFSHVYLQDDALKADATARSFWVARLARLYPLHFVTLLYVALLWTAPSNDAWNFMLSLFFLQESGLGAGSSFNVPSWSISVEMLCYFVFFFAAQRRQWLVAAIPVAIIVGAVLASNYVSGGHATHPPATDHIGRGLVGCFAGHLLWRVRERAATVSPAILVLVICLAMLFPVLPLDNGAWLSLTAWPCVLVLSLRATWMCGRPLRWLGDRSYSIYMLHFPLYVTLREAAFGSSVPKALYLPVSLVGVAALLLLADASYRFFERPLRLYLRRTFSGPVSSSGTALKAA